MLIKMSDLKAEFLAACATFTAFGKSYVQDDSYNYFMTYNELRNTFYDYNVFGVLLTLLLSNSNRDISFYQHVHTSINQSHTKWTL